MNMTSIRQFNCDDFFKYNMVELSDQPRCLASPSLRPYLKWLSKFSEYFLVAESPNGDMMGYIMGEDEKNNHGVYDYGNVCLLVCSHFHRNIGTGTRLLESFERISKQKKLSYLNLHVQVINSAAINLYKKFGFDVVDVIYDYYYYIKENEAYLMQKRLSRKRKHIQND